MTDMDPGPYHLTVRSEHPIPHDVLVEHIAVALRDFRFAGKVDVQMAHPFETGTVLFDDEQAEEYTGPQPRQYANGGYTGSIGSVAGEAHRGDNIIPKAAVDKAGFPNLLALLDMRGKNRG